MHVSGANASTSMDAWGKKAVKLVQEQAGSEI